MRTLLVTLAALLVLGFVLSFTLASVGSHGSHTRPVRAGTR